MQISDLRPGCLALFRVISEEKAEPFIGECLVPALARGMRTAPNLEAVTEGLENAFGCLEAIFAHYAFARRGRDRFDLSEIAVEALHRLTKPEDFGQFLSLDHAESLWQCFVDVCRERNRKPMEQLNAGVIAGMAELAQEIYKLDGTGSIAQWVVSGVHRTGRVEPQFLRMVDVRGIGPKITSLFLRDVTLLFDIEERLDHADRLYVQPVDKWIRLIAPYVIDEPHADDLADWILAGKVSKYARRAHVSGVRFNMGATWFGMREVRAPEFFPTAVRQLLAVEASNPRSKAELR